MLVRREQGQEEDRSAWLRDQRVDIRLSNTKE